MGETHISENEKIAFDHRLIEMRNQIRCSDGRFPRPNKGNPEQRKERTKPPVRLVFEYREEDGGVWDRIFAIIEQSAKDVQS